jgi:hypothetical protein
MQDKAQTRSRTAAAIATIFAATALTVALIGLFGRADDSDAGAREGTRNAGVTVTDGWQYNEILNPPRDAGAGITDGWMHNEVLNPQRAEGVEVADGWQYNEILNPPSDEVTHDRPGGR